MSRKETNQKRERAYLDIYGYSSHTSKRRREHAKDSTRDAYGREVTRGNSLNYTPVSRRWALFRNMGILERVIPAVPGWRAWRDRSKGTCDEVSFSPIP